MSANIFSFENSAVRTLGTPETPLFVALDVATALGYSNPKVVAAKLVDAEDIVKVEITDTMNRKQTVNCVNESGLYALIFGSKLESAKRFKKWVTSEVLPAIRRTGTYAAPATPETICSAEQLAIRTAVAKRAKNVAVDYRTIYRALYERFQIARYSDLPHDQLNEALRFIAQFELRPQIKAAPAPEPEEDSVTFTGEEVARIATFVYYWRYLFRPQLVTILELLQMVKSPMAARFWDVVHDLNLTLLEQTLEKHGYAVRQIDQLSLR